MPNHQRKGTTKKAQGVKSKNWMICGLNFKSAKRKCGDGRVILTGKTSSHVPKRMQTNRIIYKKYSKHVYTGYSRAWWTYNMYIYIYFYPHIYIYLMRWANKTAKLSTSRFRSCAEQPLRSPTSFQPKGTNHTEKKKTHTHTSSIFKASILCLGCTSTPGPRVTVAP